MSNVINAKQLEIAESLLLNVVTALGQDYLLQRDSQVSGDVDKVTLAIVDVYPPGPRRASAYKIGQAVQARRDALRSVGIDVDHPMVSADDVSWEVRVRVPVRGSDDAPAKVARIGGEPVGIGLVIPPGGGRIHLPPAKVFAKEAECPDCSTVAMHPVLHLPGHPEQRCLNGRCGHQWRVEL